MKAGAKILLIGAFDPSGNQYTYATSFYDALKRLGFTVESFNYRASFIPFMPHKLLSSKLLAPLNQMLCNRALVHHTKRFKPDLIFCIKAETITPKALRAIQKANSCRIVNFYPDNPFAVWNGNSNANVLACLPLYDCFLSWAEALTPALHAAGCKQICFFPFAFDETIFANPPTLTAAECQHYASDVCFIGTWTPEREQWLATIVETLPNVRLAIWGNQWQDKCCHHPLRLSIRGHAIYTYQMIKAFMTTNIVLNFIRTQNGDAHNMRSFEVPASGAFLLTQRTNDQRNRFFKEHESVACFATKDELIAQIRYYLAHDQERQAIARNGHAAVQPFALTKQLAHYLRHCPALQQ
jgi:spore maturation protein CgeB